MSFGIFYPVSATVFWIARCYFFALDASMYSDESYLILLISFLLIFLPCHHNLSLDSYLFSHLKQNWAPRWTSGILQLQVAIMFFFRGISLIQFDWLLRGEPFRHWATNAILHLQDSPHEFHPWARVCSLFDPTWDRITLTNSFCTECAHCRRFRLPVGGYSSKTLLSASDMDDYVIFLDDRSDHDFLYLGTKGHFDYFLSGLDLYPHLHHSLCSARFVFDSRIHLTGTYIDIFVTDYHSFVHLTLLGLFVKPTMIRKLFPTLFCASPPRLRRSPSMATCTMKEKVILGILAVFLVMQILLPLRGLWYPQGRPEWHGVGLRYAWRMHAFDKVGGLITIATPANIRLP